MTSLALGFALNSSMRTRTALERGAGRHVGDGLSISERYTVEVELGRGGMATVSLASDLKHHRRVAIKVLRPEIAAVLGPERFLREIETAARHPISPDK